MNYKFNEFILDTECFELRRNGTTLHAEPQVIELLTLLIENRDRMVSKDEINEKIWLGRIVSEAALSSRIKTARQLLGDDGRAQQMIRTIHKKGFRFVGEIEQNEDSLPAMNITLSDKHTKPAVAVLPFINLSRDDEQEYLSDGITADIIALLSKHRWIDVTARNTSFGYKGKSIDISDLGKLLNIDYVVEGSVQREGNRIRITANLVDARSGHHKWSERYKREFTDIFALQDEITEKIVARLEPEIGFAERKKVIHTRPVNLQAWDYYHMGIYHFYQFTAEDNLLSQDLLLQSQKLDTNFGEAYAWWAYSVVLAMVYWDTKPTPQLLDSALLACNKALSLDSQNATFYALQARVLLARKEYNRAISANKMAINLNPTLAVALCGLGDSLAYEGNYEESISYFDKAIALSPNDPQLWAFFTYGALALIFSKDFEKAIEWAEKASNMPNHQYWTMAHKLVANAYLGNDREMQITKENLLLECPEFTCSFARDKLFFLKEKTQVDLYIKGLRMAKISE